MVSLTVVVPATNDPPTLDRCLAALAASHDAPDDVVVVRAPASLSASGARNAGVAKATRDVVVFVDADVEVHADAIGRIRAAYDADPSLTAVFGSYDDTPEVRHTVSAFRNLLHHHVHHHSAGPAQTFWTGLGAVRREAFHAAGGFDEERYPHPSIEDIDLGNRLATAGAVIRLDPSIQGTHLKQWTLRSMVWTDLVGRGIPWVALQVRARRVATTLNCGWRHRLSALCSVSVVAGVLLGSAALALAAVVGLLGLNVSFYGLLLRRMGPVAAVAGISLHGLHHLVSVLALPLGLGAALVGSRRHPAPPVPRPSPAAPARPEGLASS